MTDLEHLRSELDAFAQPKKEVKRSRRDERILAGCEEIQRFVDEHGRSPEHGEDKEIFERLYAVRLDRLRSLPERRALLGPLDHQGLLGGGAEVAEPKSPYQVDNDELAAALKGAAGTDEITELRHVRARAEIRAAEEVAQRNRCEDFDRFQPLIEQAERELNSGVRQSRPFGRDAKIDKGDFFILGGQTVYVADKGEEFTTPQGHPDARLRVIYSNGTESNLLLRSLQRALYKDDAGRRITNPDAGPLFSQEWEEGDTESGTIYVLRSNSDEPFVVEHREVVHKIGVTGGKVENRIANAVHEATYLLADVEVVATYKLAGINRVKLENLFHRIFAPAQLDLTIEDRFGNPVKPREWFLVPLHAIDEAVERVKDGSIASVTYDHETARFIENS